MSPVSRPTRPSGAARSARRAGFTLVEILTTIAVVLLLLGLLLPSLAGMRTTARSTRCQSNLRQIAIATQQYVNHFDHFPVALRYETKHGVFRKVAWDWITTFDGQVLGPGPVWSFLDDPNETQQCTAYHGDANFAGDPFTGYNYNTSYIGGEARSVIPGWDIVRHGVRPHACRRGASCAMFGCGGYSGGANKFMRAPGNAREEMALATLYAGGQAFRHGETTNVVHVDGHVASSQTPHDGGRTDENLLNMMRFPANGFLSDDDGRYDPR